MEEDLNQWGVQPGKTKVADVQMIVSSADIREGKKADIEKKKIENLKTGTVPVIVIG